MYTVPSSFQEQLDEKFHGRFRVRWSDKRQEFQLEQKVATGQILDPPVIDPDGLTPRFDTYDDNWIRAQEGYFYVMALRNGDRMPCPICGLTVKVPVMETRESRCENCMAHERDGRYRAAFFPFNHILLEHIQNLDPYSDGPKRTQQRMRARQQEYKQREFRQALDKADYAVTFNKNQVESNPMSGYGQKTAQRTGDRMNGIEFEG